MKPKRASDDSAGSSSSNLGLGGIFRSLGGFLDLISGLAEEGGELKRSGELGDEKKGVKAVYGFSVRVGGGGEKPTIEPFGNVRHNGREAVVEQVREPMVDLFDEGDHVLVVAELPGVDAADIVYHVKDDVLTLEASHGKCKYRKEAPLPSPVSVEAATPAYRNGVLELRLPKKQ